MNLRLQLGLLMAAIIIALATVLAWVDLDTVRRGVAEEMAASNRIATQLLRRVVVLNAEGGTPALLQFLKETGRIRATELTVVDGRGVARYRSPPSPYKIGRDAPQWFAALVTPKLVRQVVALDDGELIVETDPSRAVLDGWDDLVRMSSTVLAMLVGAALLAGWRLQRALAPLQSVVGALARLEAGELATRVPPLPDPDAQRIGAAFNRMAASIEANFNAQREAIEARARLADQLALGAAVESRIEEERLAIARELHDEFGQSLTAIRSLAHAIGTQARTASAATPSSSPSSPDAIAQAALGIEQEALRAYDAMHDMIPRLRPLSLELGLVDAVRELVAAMARSGGGGLDVAVDARGVPDALAPALALNAYRIVQEALTNAVRHAAARRVDVLMHVEQDASGPSLYLSVRDDGQGMPADWQRHSGFGLRGMRERVNHLDGALEIRAGAQCGTVVDVRLPLDGRAAAPAHGNPR